MRRRVRDRCVLPFDPKLLARPGTGNGGPALRHAVLLQAACHGIEVGARHPDRALPRGPDPALQASRPGDRKRWVEPVTQAVSHQAAGRSRAVAFAHNESVKTHMARQPRRAPLPAAIHRMPARRGPNEVPADLHQRAIRRIRIVAVTGSDHGK